MKKLWVNYVTDMIMLIAFILLFFTGLFKFPGLLELLGVSIRAIPVGFARLVSTIHDIAGLSMLISALLHVILHLKWIGTMTGKVFRRNKNEQTMAD